MNNNLANIKKSVSFLNKDDCVAIPTETVYGVACDPNNNKAIKRLQKTKGREKNKPISCLCSSIDQVKKMCEKLLVNQIIEDFKIKKSE